MNILSVIFILYIILLKSESVRKIGTFWHISDVYWAASNHNCSGRISECVNQSLNALAVKTDLLHPDFVLWSSAGGPHLQTVIQQMKKVIKNIIVVPALAPVKLPAGNKYILYYQNLSDYFGEWLNDQAHYTFWKAGYYSQILKIPYKLQVIVLNTAFFCKFHIASELDDPANQWTWLSLELLKARKAKRNVYMLLSATPGITGSFKNRLFTDKHNHRYVKMIRTYADVIKGQFGGYEGGNKFHIFYNKDGRGCSWLMLSPPFYNSARLYLYDIETLEPLDYVQYHKENEIWHVQYRFTSYYMVPNISVFSLELLVTKMQQNEETFVKYLAVSNVAQESRIAEDCRNSTCTKTNICKIIAIDYSAFIECIAQDQTARLYERKVNNIACQIMPSLFVVKYLFYALTIKIYF